MSVLPGVTSADLAAVRATVPDTTNASVNLMRPGVRGNPETQVGAPRRVRLRRPNKTAEQSLPDGTIISLVLYDAPDAPYQLNDVVVVTQRDGHTLLGPITQFRVGSVEQSPRLLPGTLVGLVGVGDYQP